MKLTWTKRAVSDLIEIGDYIASNNRAAARKFVSRLRKRAAKIVETPYAGRMVPEFERESLREILEKNYRIVYLVAEKEIFIVTVFEAHRQFPKIVPGQE